MTTLSVFVYRAKTPPPAIKARQSSRQTRNAAKLISDFQTVENHVFRGRSMQIAPHGGKLTGTNTGTPVSVFVVSLVKQNGYENGAAGYGTFLKEFVKWKGFLFRWARTI